MSLIQINNLHFTYDGSYDPVFDGVSVQLDTAWRLGLVGRNGRGKTTLLRLLSGQIPHGGAISAAVDFCCFPPAVARSEELTMEVLTEVSPHAQEWELLRELARLRIPEEALWRPFATLSGGEQTRALLAALFLEEGRFLLLDEPTNHLDQAGRQLLGDYLAEKSGFLLVSHDRALLDHCADHMLAIERNGCEVQRGNFSTWWENRQRKEEFELAENEKLQREIGRLQDTVRRTAGWSDAVERTKLGSRNSGLRPDRGYIGHKSAKMMQRAKNIQQRREAAVEEKAALLKNVEKTEELKLSQSRLQKTFLVQVQAAAVCREGAPVGPAVTFTLRAGDRIALRGPNGCGKTSLLRLLNGESLEHTGVVRLASGLRVSCVAQDSEGLRGDLRTYARELGLNETLFLTILRKLDFSRVQFEKDLSALSGGQKKKVLIARSLCEDAHLLLWDEPLNYIDLFSRIQLEELLLTAKPAILFVEHDQVFQQRVATQIVDF